MNFEAANYFEVCWALDRMGLRCRDISIEAGVSRQLVVNTLSRYCGVPRPRGPQSDDVRRILEIVAAHLERAPGYPSETIETYGVALIREDHYEDIPSPLAARSSP